MSEFVIETLDHGLRVVIEPMPHVCSAAVGFLARVGSARETPALAGASHFLEHMCFKGTPTRTWQDIVLGFDRLGGYYNAYTGHDRTFYFGWVRRSDLAALMELLADMMRPALPAEQFDLERKVVLEEIAMYDDYLPDLTDKLLHERLFAGSALAWPILGTHEAIGALTPEAMANYLRQFYSPSNMVLIAAGNLDPDAVIEQAGSVTAAWQPRPIPGRAPAPKVWPGSAGRRIDRFAEQAIVLAMPAPPAGSDQAETAEAVAAILGGPNSRFYWNIVQKGVAPHASAHYRDYKGVGLMVLCAEGPPDRAERIAEALRTEAAALAADGPTDAELQRVKNTRRTHLAAEAEAPYYRLAQLADDIDTFDRPRPAAERLGAVEAIDPEAVADYLSRWPIDTEGFLVSVGPRDWPPAA